MEACRDHPEQYLASYKRPKQYEVAEALPRTGTGKVRRLALPEVLGLDETGEARPGS